MSRQLAMSNLTYVTYQTFPANTANSMQSIAMIKNFVRNGCDVKLVFPNRSKKSSKNLKELQNHYSFKESICVEVLDHNLPFKDFEGKTYFKKARFNISHFLWSRNATKYVIKNARKNEKYFTRSDWIFYFLAKKGKNVIFECHQLSKIRKFVIKRVQTKTNAKIIFTNKLLYQDVKISESFSNNIKVIENGYDEDFFKQDPVKKKESAIFVGNLLRFNKDRNINFLIQAFKDPRLNGYELLIIGGPEFRKVELENKIISKGIKNIKILGELDRFNSIKHILYSKVGILINSEDNVHSTRHTSPLKYYEYLKGNLKVVASDFPSHRSLSFSEYIYFFDNSDLESFINSIKEAFNDNKVNNFVLEELSLYSRAKKILNFFARLEGFEPPTL